MAQITYILCSSSSATGLIMKEACCLFIFLNILKILTFDFQPTAVQPLSNQQFLIYSAKKRSKTLHTWDCKRHKNEEGDEASFPRMANPRASCQHSHFLDAGLPRQESLFQACLKNSSVEDVSFALRYHVVEGPRQEASA